jgi:hypothetical protein
VTIWAPTKTASPHQRTTGAELTRRRWLPSWRAHGGELERSTARTTGRAGAVRRAHHRAELGAATRP